jgi:hypothetical protein
MKIWGFEKEISQNLGYFFMKNPLCTCQILAKIQQKKVTLNEYN